jgi:hypothetical protein
MDYDPDDPLPIECCYWGFWNRLAEDYLRFARGNVPLSVELCEASAAVNDVKRPSRFEQQRDCLFPFRSEQQARLARPEVA